MDKKNKLNLPEFAFLKSFGDNDVLNQRSVIIHINSLSVLEVCDFDSIVEDDLLVVPFSRVNMVTKNIIGKSVREKYNMILYHSPYFNIKDEENYIIGNIMLPAIRWYNNYCDTMDRMIIDNDIKIQ
jgi:hypothetical protein